MPVIVAPEYWQSWLSGTEDDIAELIAPYVGDDMQAWPVNRRVSKAKYDDADLIQPMEAAR
jgi:putative SOS response-associated peptidase YedK